MLTQAAYGSNASDAVLVVGGVHVNNLTVILDYGLTAVLLFMAARSFKKVATDADNQLRLVFQASSSCSSAAARALGCHC